MNGLTGERTDIHIQTNRYRYKYTDTYRHADF